MPIDSKLSDFVSEENKITQDVIDNLDEPRFVTVCGPLIINQIHLYCKQLLQFSKEKYDSKEVAYLINIESLLLERIALGNAHNVDITSFISLLQSQSHHYLVIHNHPSNLTFSPRDISTLVSSEISVLIVLGNKGAVYILEKSRSITPKEELIITKAIKKYKLNTATFEDVIMILEMYEIYYTKII